MPILSKEIEKNIEKYFYFYSDKNFIHTSNKPVMEKRITPSRITSLEPGQVFVFGSNLEGAHGGGAARTALQWGAKWGQGVGLQGQTYAIPTMFRTPDKIKPYVDEFIRFARAHPEKQFLVTEIGCGIAGFTCSQIAPLFREALNLPNIWLPEKFRTILTGTD